MALDTTKVMVGAGVVSIGDYVTAGGAGTLVDVGDLLEPIEVGTAFENFDVETERSTGIVLTNPTKSDFTIKVAMAQSEVENLRIGLRQPAGNKSGTGSNLTLTVTDAIKQFHQIQVVGPGPGTTGVRTITGWRAQAIAMDAVKIGKKAVQNVTVTFRLLKDTSTTPAGQYYKLVDA